MAIDVDGTTYYSTSDVLEETGISRQTFWRWRQDGRVPCGHRFRTGQLLFSESEYQDIVSYANRLEPESPNYDPRQLGLPLGSTS